MLYVGSDNLIWLVNLTNNAVIPPVYATSATVVATVTDSSGNVVSTFSMAYVGANVKINLPDGQTITGVDGNYNGTLPYTASLIDGSTYYVAAVASFGGGQRLFRGSFQAGYSLK